MYRSLFLGVVGGVYGLPLSMNGDGKEVPQDLASAAIQDSDTYHCSGLRWHCKRKPGSSSQTVARYMLGAFAIITVGGLVLLFAWWLWVHVVTPAWHAYIHNPKHVMLYKRVFEKSTPEKRVTITRETIAEEEYSCDDYVLGVRQLAQLTVPVGQDARFGNVCLICLDTLTDDSDYRVMTQIIDAFQQVETRARRAMSLPERVKDVTTGEAHTNEERSNKYCVRLPCGHQFHLPCFMEFLHKGTQVARCPNCALEIDKVVHYCSREGISLKYLDIM